MSRKSTEEGIEIHEQNAGIWENGGGRVPKTLTHDIELPLEARAIYGYMCSLCGQDNSSFPGTSRIISSLGMTNGTYYKYRNMLVDQGYLIVKLQRSEEKHGFGKNIYYLNPNPKNLKIEDLLLKEEYDNVLKGTGYGPVPFAVMDDETLSSKARGLYLFFSSYAGPTSVAFPIIPNILYYNKISYPTFLNLMNELRSHNYIQTLQSRIKSKADADAEQAKQLVPGKKAKRKKVGYDKNYYYIVDEPDEIFFPDELLKEMEKYEERLKKENEGKDKGKSAQYERNQTTENQTTEKKTVAKSLEYQGVSETTQYERNQTTENQMKTIKIKAVKIKATQIEAQDTTTINSFTSNSLISNNLYQSINQSLVKDRYDGYKKTDFIEILKKNISPENIYEDSQGAIMESLALNLIHIMAEECMRKECIINRIKRGREEVADVFLSLTQEHIVYAIESVRKTKTQKTSLRGYYVTTLFNAADTIDAYYDSL